MTWEKGSKKDELYKVIMLCIFILLSWCSCGGATPSASAIGVGVITSDQVAQVEAELDTNGMSNYTMDMNVKIQLPERTRINSEGQVEVIAAASTYGVLIKPIADRQLPTVLVYTPYNRALFAVVCGLLAENDYNVLIVDTFGTGAGAGVWNMLDFAEHHNIAYLVDNWIPAQSWSDGKVAMFGGSYLAMVQFMAAGLCERDSTGTPTHLKALVPLVPASDCYRDIFAQGGMVSSGFKALYTTVTALLAVIPPITNASDETMQMWKEHLEAIATVLIPSGLDLAFQNDIPWYEERSMKIYWPIKPDPAAQWGGWSNPEGAAAIPSKLPAMVFGGWFDIFTRGTVNDYIYGLANHAPSDKILIMGPWYHIDPAFGFTMGLSGTEAITTMPIIARWLDWKVKGNNDPFLQKYPVMTYVMGAERWRAEKSWPLPDSRISDKSLYLSKKKASWIFGDLFSLQNADNNYSLVESPTSSDYKNNDPVLKHNPANLHGMTGRAPVRWMMGMPAMVSQISKLMEGTDIDALMPWEDERSNENGVLTFTTAPLESDTEIIGPLALKFWAKTAFAGPLAQDTADKIVAEINKIVDLDSSAFNTMNQKNVQWIVEVNDVYPNGRAKNITSGWLNASHRQYDPNDPTKLDPNYKPFDPFYNHSDKHPSNIVDGQIYPYVVEMWPTDNRFKKGHRIRITIKASDFPHFLPILIPSKNTIVLGGNYKAHLDFKTVNVNDEGKTWMWITSKKNPYYSGPYPAGSAKKEFKALNDYILQDVSLP